ncbi:hypothetical protein Aab01nite_58200 [Paractinoplanes abujensis]|uniref:Anti-anti-sigma factor n=1 Tax=Paractinoplanes abujensis TaxID=882441 RepID=A0A7W7CX20_9ACTN|nr:STAS domain-containing protein [Actinoplanes abujensis]MBB4696237.1 anti-anti-sigma factor [Actinoplanes abujensis]GID22230.1 hypothetical protein Aab01nite_58200 [Actinoplanes abujensis]
MRAVGRERRSRGAATDSTGEVSDRDRADPWAGLRIAGAGTSGRAVLHAYGEFDRDNRELILAAAREAVAAGHRRIDLDLTAVTFIDAATVATLLTCRDLIAAAGGGIRIVNAGGIVAHVLTILDVKAALIRPAAAARAETTPATGRVLADPPPVPDSGGVPMAADGALPARCRAGRC